MAAVLTLTRTTAEPSLVIKWGGMPAAWRWQGRLFELLVLHSHWTDDSGHQWFRVESVERTVFLLGCGPQGWTAAPWPARAGAGRRAAG